MDKSEQKKILYVFGGEEASGAEFVIERLIRNNNNYNNTILLSPGKYADRLSELSNPFNLVVNKNLKKINIKSKNKIILVFTFLNKLKNINYFIFRLIKRENISIVHCNTIVPAIYVLPSLFILKIIKRKIKWVWSDHDLEYTDASMLNKFCGYLVYCFDKTLVVSNAVRNKYDSNKVEVLYNGIDLSQVILKNDLREKFRTANNLPMDSFIFGIMGHIIPRKGVLELCEAFLDEFDKNTDTYLIVAGKPIDKLSKYNKTFESYLKKHDNILYLGYLNNVSEFYNGIDVLVNNSSKEGEEPLGTTILEGLAHKKIVMVSEVGGSKEIINNKSGYLFEPNNSVSLKKTLLLVKNLNSNEVELIKNEARNNIETKFEIKIMIKNYNKIIDSLY